MSLSAAVYAQQKPSQRSYADEVRKVRAKQAERKVMLSRQQPVGDSISTTPLKPAPATRQLKPSQGPLQLPARVRKQQ